MTIQKLLKKLNCNDIAATEARFMDDYSFFVTTIKEMIRDPSFITLGEQIKAKNEKTAFDIAHMLKGVVANCGITNLYNSLIEIVEPLRKGNPNYINLEKKYKEMILQKENIQKILEKI